MTNTSKLYGKILKNLSIFQNFQDIGCDYILNPETMELHSVYSNFFDSHNLHISNLENFIGLTNTGVIPMHNFIDGTELPIFDFFTGEKLGDYVLNKCQHCWQQ